jgi:hypothetical protein
MKYDVQFESEHLDSQLPVIAKWEHIEKLYKQDKHRLIRMLYKLTDTHLSPVAHYHESELGCPSHEPHSSSRNLQRCVSW